MQEEKGFYKNNFYKNNNSVNYANEKNGFPMRQIHLDFHTSELIENVAGEFDAKQFSDTLIRAHVNSINLFGRCHHGMMYYESSWFPERIHPHLKTKRLLEEQTAACRAKGIKVNLYTSVRWDVYTVKHNREWLCIDENGAISDYENKSYFEAGFYKNLCVNTPYRDFLKAHLQEMMSNISADGIWFDASFLVECCCETCMDKMRRKGLDPRKKEDRQAFAEWTYQDFVRDMSDFIRKDYPDYDIFYNKGHVGKVDRPVKDSYTYGAMESLPGGPWDYLDFPHSQRYLRNWGLPTVGLTGKFHTSWGDFHSFRDPLALEYECFHMLALGAGCNIGDQLEPSGVLSKPVYELIGRVYAQVEKKEPWCIGAVPLSDVAMLVPEEFIGAGTGNLPSASQGACRLLQEAGYQFEFIDSRMDMTGYEVLILPDLIPVDNYLKKKLQDFMDKGGRIILSHEAGIDPESGDFAIREWGISYCGQAYYEPDFLVPQGEIGKGLPETEHVMYLRGSEVNVTESGKALCMVNRPVFNRTYEHFSSHMHSPSSGEAVYPGIVRGKQSVYFAHPIFSTYYMYHPGWCKTLFRNTMNMLLSSPLIKHNGPSTLEVDLLEQKKEKRLILHLLHYIPEHRSLYVDTVEDIIPLYDIEVWVKTDKELMEAVLVPEGENTFIRMEGEYAHIRVQKIEGHRMIALPYR